MSSTGCLGWNGFQALKSCLSTRLLRFTRETDSDGRPQKSQYDAAFFEADLRYALMTMPALAEVSQSDYDDMDQVAQNLLESLNDMVNTDLFEVLERNSGNEEHGGSQEPATDSIQDIEIIQERYPQLSALVSFLQTTPGKFNLISGPGLSLLTFPAGHNAKLALDRVSRWRACLAGYTASANSDTRVLHPICLPETAFPTKDLAPIQLQAYQKRASLTINAIFQEIRYRSCGMTHEVKLGVSEKWQTASHHTVLDMFISCCPDGSAWQQAQCGAFGVEMEHFKKEDICMVIQRARDNGKKLHLCVDQQGMFDVSDQMPAALSTIEDFTTESLSELLEKRWFTRITPRDYLGGGAIDKFGSREKASLALALARCLLDFFDEDLELSSHGWDPDAIYFLRAVGAPTGDRTVYISLRPNTAVKTGTSDLVRTVGPGNPVLLSFAKLLLEIDSGEKIPMKIHAQSQANIPKWGEMCAFVNAAENTGSGDYLKAVEGCLYLHMALPRSADAATDADESDTLRKAIYDRIVRNLELMVNPQTSKKRRRDSVKDSVQQLPLAKKLLISTPDAIELPTPLPSSKDVLYSKKIARPTSREDFNTAIVCALPLEYDAVTLLIDEFWDEDGDGYGKAKGDPNIYTTGRIGTLNVVLVLLANMGKVNAAVTSVGLTMSYPRLQLILVTGICGGVPYPPGEEELLLGDVVISRSIVQYDFGRQYPDEFVVKDTARDSLGGAPRNLRNLLALFETQLGRDRLEKRAATHLQTIQSSAARRRRGAKYQYPGAGQDKLFQPGYRHQHRHVRHCACASSSEGSGISCPESRRLSCEELACHPSFLVRRERVEEKLQLEKEGRSTEAQTPMIFLGSIGSGDMVVKSGEDRDRLAKQHGLIAFEMEGAGVWGEGQCVVVKAVCDYADSHKNKVWQHFAAATAASVTRALLERHVSRPVDLNN